MRTYEDGREFAQKKDRKGLSIWTAIPSDFAARMRRRA